MSKATVLTATKRIQVLDTICLNKGKSNREIADKLDVSAKQVSGVRVWLNKKGYMAYRDELEGKVAEMESIIDSILDEKPTYKIGTFTNQLGTNKEFARNKMVNYIDLSGVKTGKVLTLPCSDWFIESKIQNQVTTRFSYVACERTNEVFQEMVSNMHNFGTNNQPYLGSVSDKIYEAKEDEYSHAILDYCGTLDKTRNELIHACNNNIVKKGETIAVTLLKARCTDPWVAQINKLRAELTGKVIRDNDNGTAMKTFFEFLSSVTEFELTEIFEYRDSSPMMLIVLTRK